MEVYSRYIPDICKNLECVRHIPQADICQTYDTIRIPDVLTPGLHTIVRVNLHTNCQHHPGLHSASLRLALQQSRYQRSSDDCVHCTANSLSLSSEWAENALHQKLFIAKLTSAAHPSEWVPGCGVGPVGVRDSGS
jgi:hypothetical protein